MRGAGRTGCERGHAAGEHLAFDVKCELVHADVKRGDHRLEGPRRCHSNGDSDIDYHRRCGGCGTSTTCEDEELEAKRD